MPFGRGQQFARAQLALGSDADQFAGDVADALLDPRLARLPGDPAQPVELRPGLFGAEARQDLDVLDRDKQPVVAGIEHAQAVMRRAGDIDRLERLVAADAMVGMDDEIARREVAASAMNWSRLRRRRGSSRQPVAEDVLLAEKRPARRSRSLARAAIPRARPRTAAVPRARRRRRRGADRRPRARAARRAAARPSPR